MCEEHLRAGAIGEPLRMDRFHEGVPQVVESLREDGWAAAARVIITTDTGPKAVSRKVSIGGHSVSLTGIAKGPG